MRELNLIITKRKLIRILMIRKLIILCIVHVRDKKLPFNDCAVYNNSENPFSSISSTQIYQARI